MKLMVIDGNSIVNRSFYGVRPLTTRLSLSPVTATHSQPAASHFREMVPMRLAEGEESARMSYHLATILTGAPLDFQPDQNLRRPVKPELYDIFLRLESPGSCPWWWSGPCGWKPA